MLRKQAAARCDTGDMALVSDFIKENACMASARCAVVAAALVQSVPALEHLADFVEQVLPSKRSQRGASVTL